MEGMEGGRGLTGQCVQCAACSPAMMWQCSCPHVRPLHPLSLLPYIHPMASLFAYSSPLLLFAITTPFFAYNLPPTTPLSVTASHIKRCFSQGCGENHPMRFYFMAVFLVEEWSHHFARFTNLAIKKTHQM